MYKSPESTIRQILQEHNKPVVYQDEMVLEATDSNLAYIQKVAADAAKHHKRCQIRLKLIDNP